MSGTIWSLVPPLVAIILALVTKEVYSSLFIGIAVAALFYSDFHIVKAYHVMFEEGFIKSLSNSGNVGILIFLVTLGVIVVLINKAGGSAAYGKWAEKKIRTRKGSMFVTFILGVLIFVDDYFNCLTVGSVMRPVTDQHQISRAKLAYLIDATAAPICMIAPISSWAAAVAGVVEGEDGLALFVKAIPYNLYSFLTITMILMIITLDIDFGPMKRFERNALNGDIFSNNEVVDSDEALEAVEGKGKVKDLLLPVGVLIVFCIIGMIYTGGFFKGVDFVSAFANCDAPLGLSMGSVAALIVIIAFYVCRRVLSFQECMGALSSGFKTMVGAILILTFAWTLSRLTKALGAQEYVSGIFAQNIAGVTVVLPAIVFVVAIFLSFSIGSSWGTFGILLPIVVGIHLPSQLLIISIAACLAGAVCGDHCSPISDTTIMASAGAQCNHMDHVSTQLPYVAIVATISFLGYLLAGIVQQAWIVLPVSILVLLTVLFAIKKYQVNATKVD